VWHRHIIATPVWLVVLLEVLPPIAAIGGAVSAPLLQGRFDQHSWLHEKRFEAYLGFEEAIARLTHRFTSDKEDREEYGNSAIDDCNRLLDWEARIRTVGPVAVYTAASRVVERAQGLVKYCTLPGNWDSIRSTPFDRLARDGRARAGKQRIS
jgi:hypothetical protein